MQVYRNLHDTCVILKVQCVILEVRTYTVCYTRSTVCYTVQCMCYTNYKKTTNANINYNMHKLVKRSLLFKQCSLYISNKSHVSSILESFENCSPHSWFSSCTFITSQPSCKHHTATPLHTAWVVFFNDLKHRDFYVQIQTD